MVIYVRKRDGCCKRWGIFNRNGELLEATGQYNKINGIARRLGATHIWHT